MPSRCCINIRLSLWKAGNRCLEYEKAQISERTRRGKRHRAQAGLVNALTGAPFGYRYVRKAEGAPARYEVLESEALVVREVFRRYTEEWHSLGALARWLTTAGIRACPLAVPDLTATRGRAIKGLKGLKSVKRGCPGAS